MDIKKVSEVDVKPTLEATGKVEASSHEKEKPSERAARETRR